MDRSPIKELTDRMVDLVAKRSGNNTVISSIKELRVLSLDKSGRNPGSSSAIPPLSQGSSSSTSF